jgi:Carbohydrate binding module (family 35)/Glycine-rich protein domain (DUF2403)/Putative TOS1-like glycosyl hydrolase (DUF2401)
MKGHGRIAFALCFVSFVLLSLFRPLPASAQTACAIGATCEAENAVLGGGVVVSTLHAGYTGSGFADYAGNGTGYVEWTVSVPTTGTYSLGFRYGNGGTADRPMLISVNGTVVNGALSFPVTGWTSWTVRAQTANLPAGSVKIRATEGPNGPNVDNLTVTAGATPTATATATTAPAGCAIGSTCEAETATLGGGVVASTLHAGYTGSGFADYAGNGTGYVEWTVSVPTAGTYSLSFRYGNGGTADRPMSISVNGTVVNSALSFPVTGWTSWTVRAQTATLPAGSVKIRATESPNGPNIDNLVVTAGSATATPTATATTLAPTFKPGELDPASNGASITFQNIGKAGWFPSRRDPAVGPCDFSNDGVCCKTKLNIASDRLTPWDEDLILSMRGPLLVKQLVVYQPNPADASQWQRVSVWDDRTAASPRGVAFNGNGTETNGFGGVVGTECIVDASTDKLFPCGSGSVPFCPASSTKKYSGWQGSKLFVLLSSMPYADSGKVPGACSQNNTGGWYNAPWLGLSVGELVRSGAFGTCHCYSATGSAGDGCGQLNAFETVNDNNSYRNFDVYSTNFIGYAGYVGEGPCGGSCKANLFPAAADLISKSTSLEANSVVTGPGLPVGAAFRRPEAGYRYFIALLDVDTRTVQLAIVHPSKVPPALQALLPDLPASISRSVVDATLQVRLPR